MTQKQAKKIWKYNPETGELTWKVARGNAKPGGKAGNPDKRGYLRVQYKGKKYLVHRLAWLIVHGYLPENQVDHIDRDPSNNRLSNLREVTASCNMKNASKLSNNTSGVTGVHLFKKTGQWTAFIRVNGHLFHLGLFSDFREAVIARHKAEVKHNWPGCNSSTPAIRYLRANN